MKDTKHAILGIALVVGGVLLGTRTCNGLWNDFSKSTHGYDIKSQSSGLTGHLEFTKYFDGSHDVKIYPGLGHRMFDSELHQDLNGDGLVDRIRKNGAEWKMNSLTELFVREFDYADNKERFDEADKHLQNLIEKYKK